MSTNNQIQNSGGGNAKSGGELQGISIAGKIIGLLVIIWLVSLSYYAFAFFILGMLPSIVSLILDRGRCNFVGILPFLFDIALNYEKSVAAKEAMLEPFTWVIIYGFAIIGLMLIFVLPNISAIIFTIKAEMKLKNLVAEQASLIDEWGDEVKNG